MLEECTIGTYRRDWVRLPAFLSPELALFSCRGGSDTYR
nr:MAG TPA: hypothetical protein [Caudoviricetes sp.]